MTQEQSMPRLFQPVDEHKKKEIKLLAEGIEDLVRKQKPPLDTILRVLIGFINSYLDAWYKLNLKEWEKDGISESDIKMATRDFYIKYTTDIVGHIVGHRKDSEAVDILSLAIQAINHNIAFKNNSKIVTPGDK